MMQEDNKEMKMYEYQFMMQHVKQMEMQMNELQQQVVELQTLKDNLDELQNLKGKEDGLFSFGGGLFVKGKIENSSEVVVNVGSGVCVTKTVNQAKELIDKQVAQLRDVVMEIQNEIKKVTTTLIGMQKELQ